MKSFDRRELDGPFELRAAELLEMGFPAEVVAALVLGRTLESSFCDLEQEIHRIANGEALEGLAVAIAGASAHRTLTGSIESLGASLSVSIDELTATIDGTKAGTKPAKPAEPEMDS